MHILVGALCDSLSDLNSIPYEALHLAYKVVKNKISFDLVELLLNPFSKNLEII